MPKKYPLSAILRVRQIRQDAAERELHKKKEEELAVLKRVDRQKARIETYTSWRTGHEEKLFKGIIGKLGTKTDVTDLKEKLEGIKQRYEDHLKRLEKLQAEYQKAQEATEAARKVYQAAMFNVQKLKQHKDTWIEGANKEEEAQLEKEAEEFKVKK